MTAEHPRGTRGDECMGVPMEEKCRAGRQRPGCRYGPVRLLGERILPHHLQFQGTTVGGLSGIDYDTRAARYLLVSDDRSVLAPARFYTAQIELDAGGLHDVVLTGVTFFRRPDGKAYPSLDQWGPEQFGFPPADRGVFGTVDPEEIRVDPRTGNMLWSQEGILAESGAGERIVVDPALRISTPDGCFVRDLPVPCSELYSGGLGPRQDRAIESVTYAGHGNLVVSVLEDPLLVDGPEPTVLAGRRTRMTVQSSEGKILAQYAYELDPLPPGPDGTAADGNTGVSSILACDPGTSTRFLVLERAFVAGRGNRVRVYEADVSRATDVLAAPSLVGAPITPARKTLLVDLADMGLDRLENIEGMSWGPDVCTGERTLVLVSDDNFSATQRTQVIALAMARAGGTRAA
ncbi:esterase-like activity of phytase family protein [Pseudonocardia xinjiangensis]|uniref:esterase-like activity of phytase family protein n=1 Tax=Pseudonocardia xinjiangensis TaxID=75289 RepID=UPI003D8B541F